MQHNYFGTLYNKDYGFSHGFLTNNDYQLLDLIYRD